MSNTLYLLRSVSGAGKTTLAHNLLQLPNSVICSADDYFYALNSEGKSVYNFNIENLGKAHRDCKEFVKEVMEDCFENVIVHNTNTSEKEIKPYLDLAEEYGYQVISLIVENRHRGKNVHNVPEATLDKQECRLRNSIILR